MTKNLFIIYDKAQKKSAETLYNLLSNNQEIKASIYTQKEAPKLVSREKVIYLGEKCSSELNYFKDTYNETGIHIGTMETKAWIRCEKYDWGKDSLLSFESKLCSYCSSCQMEPNFTEYKKRPRSIILRDFILGKEHWEGRFLELMKDNDLFGKEKRTDIIRLFENHLGLTGIPIMKYAGEPEIRKWQYLLGTLMFYKDYLDKFLGINQNKEANQELTPDEKKK